MMTIDIEALELLARASPGPWHVTNLDDDWAMSAVVITRTDHGADHLSMREETWPVADVIAATLLQHPRYVDPPDGRWEANAALIAARRNALPELLRLARLGLAAEERGPVDSGS
jgi:hypothetical protein